MSREPAHPVRAVKRAATPKAVKKARRPMHPLDNTIYRVEGRDLAAVWPETKATA
jgi:hypothetical protein